MNRKTDSFEAALRAATSVFPSVSWTFRDFFHQRLILSLLFDQAKSKDKNSICNVHFQKLFPLALDFLLTFL
ncbi:MAG: hypothetical protein NMK33_04055 [Candidatus Cardinium sp.]|uniref:hypothetical protein n=1 Tax=Cardinium endosymbiont of Dermatophagoides farinae TaxID=2597823 RepID=UPI001183B08A|nr:hypothetical protein [Cardinium endosymbiont of Dermatophagoides farinae]TSJ80612.1 hypothetical protein FPG78_00780 [Cardinium endosymbiont of Dermatophagoides farinae]UWW96605.1 MAG: hypothetical protein NMK33_04055 [Candidatus Cardinium sp.]